MDSYNKNNKIKEFRKSQQEQKELRLHETPSKKICHNCGFKIEGNAAFCGQCGAKLPEISQKFNEPLNNSDINIISGNIPNSYFVAVFPKRPTSKEMILCPNCSEKQFLVEDRCGICGIQFIFTTDKKS